MARANCSWPGITVGLAVAGQLWIYSWPGCGWPDIYSWPGPSPVGLGRQLAPNSRQWQTLSLVSPNPQLYRLSIRLSAYLPLTL